MLITLAARDAGLRRCWLLLEAADAGTVIKQIHITQRPIMHNGLEEALLDGVRSHSGSPVSKHPIAPAQSPN
ncbi:MAG: hypothetical protein GIW99_03725 [Candidatus Eremiobacteraeota bacterium]|nr:hypothetical protein [Candidatus Eremiobacteraeota bacterium]